MLMLGPIEVRAGGRRLSIGGPRQKKLLAVLLLNANRSLTLDRLVAELWEEPPSSVRQQVHNSVGSLRRALAPAGSGLTLLTTDAGYQLNVAPASTDVEQFRGFVARAKEADAAGEAERAIADLRSALGLWRGEALAGLEGRSITAAAAGLEEERLTAIEHLTASQLRAGDHAAVVAKLRDLVAEHPLRESFRADLMSALHRSGRPAEALAVYDEGRRLMAEEFGLDPGPRLRALFADILADSGETDTAADTTAEAAPEVPVEDVEPTATKCFLPNDTRDFSGRAAELGQFTAEMQRSLPSALVISAIDGMGGVGKTTLAVHLVHGIADEFPDGQYFIDLRGFSLGQDPVPPEQALDSLLRDCGVPAELVPPSLEARAALWRSHMAGKRAVVVLDNAIDVAQVRPLIPGTPGILVVVTSRRRLTALEGSVPLSLDVFPREDAVSLFVQIVGEERTAPEPEAVVAAVELCGRLPLAIRIAAARLRDRRSWTVANLVERLETQRRNEFLRTGDRSVASALKLSLRYLSPTQQRLFRVLSLHPGHNFDAYVAAALADIPVAEAEDHLEALLDDNLLRQDVVGRYYFHDLVRECARQLCEEVDGEDGMRAAVGRLLDYYLCAVRDWSGHLRTNLQDLEDVDVQHPRAEAGRVRPVAPKDADTVLRDEYANVQAVAHLAADEGWPRHAWRLVRAIQPYIKNTHQIGVARALFEAGLLAAEADHDRHGRSIMTQAVAGSHREHGDHEASESLLGRALELSRSTGNRYTEATQVTELALMHYYAERMVPAYEGFRAAEALAAELERTSLDWTLANCLGVVCRNLGRWDESLGHFRRALEIEERRGGSMVNRCQLWWNIAITKHLMGRNHEARRELDHVRSVSAEIGYEMGELLVLAGLCSTERALGNMSSAIEFGRQALLLARRFGHRVSEYEALNDLGDATLGAGDIDRAAEIFTQAYDYAVEYGLNRGRGSALEGLAHVARARGRFAEARDYWERAVEAHPDDVVEAGYARAHLVAVEDESIECFRCRVLVHDVE
ncbi:BTAD domain-containing putative transcriptional regulator [Kutzneria sp. NPDC052558]|uniref:AfsR/SARP family transcriptional regulator n=1 Tax=Kutzneria sp. NPDC052558 TaxID=3364121 RepID=UPI0037C571CE